jgi:hypothetical protein
MPRVYEPIDIRQGEHSGIPDETWNRVPAGHLGNEKPSAFAPRSIAARILSAAAFRRSKCDQKALRRTCAESPLLRGCMATPPLVGLPLYRGVHCHLWGGTPPSKVLPGFGTPRAPAANDTLSSSPRPNVARSPKTAAADRGGRRDPQAAITPEKRSQGAQNRRCPTPAAPPAS